MAEETKKYHYFLDEAGDTTFFGKGGIPMLGKNGVSEYFSIGLCSFNEPLQPIRNKIVALENEIANNPFFKVGSVQKKMKQTGKFYFHATDDIPEIRMLFLNLIMSIEFSFEVAISKKDIEKFVRKHNRSDKELYTDLLAHLLHSKMQNRGKHIFMVSQRGNTTRQATLQMALNKAVHILQANQEEATAKGEIILDVVNQKNEPLLNFTDYLCWAVQRKYEKGEERFYEFIKSKIKDITEL
jgi:hypothetical protein